jgi:hypothetical protein
MKIRKFQAPLLIMLIIALHLPKSTYSQNLTIVDFEKLLKLDLSTTNTELNKFGLNFNSSKEKDSSGCQIITWKRNDNCNSIDCILYIDKEFCEGGRYTMIAKFVDTKYYENFKLQLAKNGYELKETIAENKSLLTYYPNYEKKLLIYLGEERKKGSEEESEITVFSIGVIGK